MNEVTKMERIDVQEHAVAADPMVSMIERVVMNPDADLDKLERMLALKERMDTQNAKVAFARALSEARANMPPIIKDATVDFTSSKGRTHYKHETLAGIAKQIDPILAEHGLSYRFRTEQGQGGVRVTCIIAHAEGHSEETSLSCAPDGSGNKNPFQAVGSAVTYLQRYTLKAALGLSAEVDDDANGAAPRPDARRDDPPKFDASAAAKRITAKLNSAESIGDLASRWKEELSTIAEIRDANPSLYEEVIRTKEARKTTINATDLGDDEIPY